MNAKQAIELLGFDMSELKPTHQLKSSDHSDVVAWQYLPNNPIPIWVFRNFHCLDFNCPHPTLTHRSGEKVGLTDWIVMAEKANTCFILTDAEFQLCFMPLPSNA